MASANDGDFCNAHETIKELDEYLECWIAGLLDRWSIGFLD
jgi:hypothetical protein